MSGKGVLNQRSCQNSPDITESSAAPYNTPVWLFLLSLHQFVFLLLLVFQLFFSLCFFSVFFGHIFMMPFSLFLSHYFPYFLKSPYFLCFLRLYLLSIIFFPLLFFLSPPSTSVCVSESPFSSSEKKVLPV